MQYNRILSKRDNLKIERRKKFKIMKITSKRLAKRSIIGTRVCAPGSDGLYHSGVIQAVKTPASSRDNQNSINITPSTRYSVRFDQKLDMARRPIREFGSSELIGPGFRGMPGVFLKPSQKVFLTFNGRECSGDVIQHDTVHDEVTIRITPIGSDSSTELKKRLDEVRLLESRRSARLADQERDTDFARLADMAGDRRRASHSIEVPLALTQHNSRKRRPSVRDDDPMDECNAALVLMKLSCSPHSRSAMSAMSSSPGSSSASWCSGSSSPPLSDEGVPHSVISTGSSGERIRTTSVSTSDEGIDDDLNTGRTKIYQCLWTGCSVRHIAVADIERHVRRVHLGTKKARHSLDDDDSLSNSDHEEEFYYEEIENDDEVDKPPSPPSPPTLSHRDMARPPYEDPEYQKKIVGNMRQQITNFQNPIKPPLPVVAATASVITTVGAPAAINATPINIPTHPYMQNSPKYSKQSSPQKHVRLSPRPSTSYAPYPSPPYSSAMMNVQHNVNVTLGTTSATFNHNLAPAVTHQPQMSHHPQHPHLHNQHHHQQNQKQQQQTQLHNLNPQEQHQQQLQKHHHPHYHQQQQHQQQQQQQQQQQHHQQQQQLSLLATSAPATLAVNMHSPTTSHHQLSGGSSSHSAGVGLAINRSPASPNQRRPRGENKKCRKVYGMDNKEQWCTQCKWKKACSRFGD